MIITNVKMGDFGITLGFGDRFEVEFLMTSDGRFIVYQVSQYMPIADPGTSGDDVGGELIELDEDYFHANTDYDLDDLMITARAIFDAV